MTRLYTETSKSWDTCNWVFTSTLSQNSDDTTSYEESPQEMANWLWLTVSSTGHFCNKDSFSRCSGHFTVYASAWVHWITISQDWLHYTLTLFKNGRETLGMYFPQLTQPVIGIHILPLRPVLAWCSSFHKWVQVEGTPLLTLFIPTRLELFW